MITANVSVHMDKALRSRFLESLRGRFDASVTLSRVVMPTEPGTVSYCLSHPFAGFTEAREWLEGDSLNGWLRALIAGAEDRIVYFASVTESVDLSADGDD